MTLRSFDNSVAIFDNDLTEDEGKKIEAVMEKLIREQRARLTAESPYPWWADVVFFMRDIKSTCALLNKMDRPELASSLAEIVGKTSVALLFHAFKDMAEQERQKKIGETMLKLTGETEVINAILEKEVRQVFGTGTQIQ